MKTLGFIFAVAFLPFLSASLLSQTQSSNSGGAESSQGVEVSSTK
jgi:hypothetical protein